MVSDTALIEYQVSGFEPCRYKAVPNAPVSQILPTQNPTQAAQKKDNVLISISQKQTLFSGKATLQQSVVFLVLFRTRCSNSSAFGSTALLGMEQ